MATVTVVTAERTLQIEATSIVDGNVVDGHLILTRHDGGEIDVGAVSGMRLSDGTTYTPVDAFSYIGTNDPGAVANGSVWFDTDDAGPAASDTQKGLVELATTAEATTGTDTTRAVTPVGLKAVADTKQPTDADLTAFAALAPANDDIVQRKAGVWANRTMAQLLVDSGALPKAGGVMTGTASVAFVATDTGQKPITIMVSGDTFNRYTMYSDGFQQWGPGSGSSSDVSLYRSGANALNLLTADLKIESPGRGIRIKEGSGAKMGINALVAGTVTVANTSVTAASRIFLTNNNLGGTAGFLRISARTAGTSFTILSSSATDTSTIAWHIIEPA